MIGNVQSTIFIQLGISLVVAVVTALLTVYLSLRRFYREKWWEAKLRSYTEIIEALHHMKRDADESLEAQIEQRETESEFYKTLEKRAAAAWAEIRKIADVGDFLFSREAMSVLEKFLKETADDDPNTGWWEQLETIQSAIDRCLPEFKAAARRDLALPPLETR